MLQFPTLPWLIHSPESYAGALLTRFFIGFVEAAFFPGALFLLSKWQVMHAPSLIVVSLNIGQV